MLTFNVQLRLHHLNSLEVVSALRVLLNEQSLAIGIENFTVSERLLQLFFKVIYFVFQKPYFGNVLLLKIHLHLL